MFSSRYQSNRFLGLGAAIVLRGSLGILVALASAACMDAPTSNPKNPTGGGSAQTFLVDADYIGAYPSLGVAPDGRLHASYYSKFDWGMIGGGALRHAVLENGIWSPETVDGSIYDTSKDVGQFTSLATDGQGGIHITYWDVGNSDLKYATLLPGPGQSWVIETVSDQDAVCEDSDLVLDSSGIIYIGYCAEGQILLATRTNGAWNSEPVMVVGNDVRAKVSLNLDSTGSMHVAFFDAVEKKIKYRARTLGVWGPIEEVTSTPLGANEVRMAFMTDLSLAPHVIYYDIVGQKLVHAFRGGSEWQTEVVTDVGDITYQSSDAISGSVGYLSPSGLTDKDGRLHVSFFDGNIPALKHAVLDTGVWTFETIDQSGDVGRTSAIAEDANGTIHIIYRDTTNNDLKYAYVQ